MLVKLDLTIDENRKELYNFYKRHYDAPHYLVPETPESLDGLYYIYTDGTHMLAATKHYYPSPFLMITSTTVVHKDLRGQGIGTKVNDAVEEMAKKNGIQKIACHIYVDNIPSLILKLKRGYLVEGLLRDHDTLGQHEYILGKEIK